MQTTPTPAATRERILEAALKLFADQGYLRTSVRDIAERVGITKAAVHYHFPRKIDIMLALAEPVWQDFETMLSEAERLPDPRWPAIEGWLDVLLKHRRVFEMIAHDPALITEEKTYAYMFSLVRRVLAVFAGPDASFGARMRAAQAMAVLSDPVFLFPEVADHTLRTEALAGVRRLLADEPVNPDGGPDKAGGPHAPSPGGRPPGRLGGKPGALTRRTLADRLEDACPPGRPADNAGEQPGGDTPERSERRPRSGASVAHSGYTVSGPLDGGRLLSGEGNTSPPAYSNGHKRSGHASAAEPPRPRRRGADAQEPVSGPLDGGRLLSGEGNTSPPGTSVRDARPQARRRPGRPAALTDQGRVQARRMHAEGLPAEQIAMSLGVSRATVYRYLRS